MNPTNVHVIPDEWEWDSLAVEYADMFGIPYEIVESAAAHPTYSVMDPHSAEVGWEIRRNRRGDVVAIVGYRDPAHPVILHCHIITPQTPRRSSLAGVSGGGGSGTDRPKSWRAIRQEIVRRGYQIRPGGKHDRVETPEGRFLMSLPTSAGDQRTLVNVWAEFRRRTIETEIRDRVARGDLLHEEGAGGED